MKLVHLSALAAGLEVVATILHAVKVITVSMRSLTSVSDDAQTNMERKKSSRVGIHKWIILAGAVVGLITIAYLENILARSKAKKGVDRQKEREQLETVYVTDE